MVTAPALGMKLRIALVAGALLALTVAAVPALQQPATVSRPPADDAAPVDIVVQGAVDSELRPLLAALSDKQEIQIAAWTFWRGRLAGKRVVVSRTEVGPMNASVATTLAIVTFHPRLIINQGTAGALEPSLKVYDIVVGRRDRGLRRVPIAHADAGAGVSQSRWTPTSHWLRLGGKQRVEFKQFPGDRPAIAAVLDTPLPAGAAGEGHDRLGI